ncbi:helix-turn-helix transcriptional regulator [Streptomyces sp. NPDC001890]|uniref:helix-turn-helix transcriptional regulator n=1 Tax=Streptomyces sp. NPDC001890 TaxID=3364620 RepID=UPI0036915A3B
MPFTIGLPANRSETPGAWKPSPAQHRVLLGLVQGLSAAQHAEEHNRGITTVKDYRRCCRVGLSVKTDRALARATVRNNLITVVPIPGAKVAELPADVVQVWRHLADDVPDDDLASHIVVQTGLPGIRVDTALFLLRSEGESDCKLIARGFACGVLTGREETQPPLRKVRKQPTPPPRSVPQPVAHRRPLRPAGTDPLGLVPASMPWQPDGFGILNGHVVTGLSVDVVRATPDACRTALTTLLRNGQQKWGPVLGDVEGSIALFLLKPGVLPDGWRTAGARLWRRGALLRGIPAPSIRGGTRLYWAFEGNGGYWQPEILASFLTPAQAAAASDEREPLAPPSGAAAAHSTRPAHSAG